MGIHGRMKPRSEREKDLLKYGRRQGRNQVIAVAEAWLAYDGDHSNLISYLSDKSWYEEGRITPLARLIALIKGEK